MNLYTNKLEIISLEEKLPSEGYEIVKTFQELNGKNWLLYSAKQAEFYNENPEATPEEVYNMALYVYVPSLDDLKANKFAEIEQADKASEVFYINDFPLWLDEDRRANLLSLNIPTARRLKQDNVSLIMDVPPYATFELPVDAIEDMLYALQNYATKAYVNTNTLKQKVSAAETEEALNKIAIIGYPEPLRF